MKRTCVQGCDLFFPTVVLTERIVLCFGTCGYVRHYLLIYAHNSLGWGRDSQVGVVPCTIATAVSIVVLRAYVSESTAWVGNVVVYMSDVLCTPRRDQLASWCKMFLFQHVAGIVVTTATAAFFPCGQVATPRASSTSL